MNKKSFLEILVFGVFLAGLLFSVPKIAKFTVEHGIFKAPSNYEIYKDKI